MDRKRGSRINGGNSATGRRASDFYPTPPEATMALLQFLNLPPGTRVWEPACGQGHIVRVLEQMGYSVIGTDIQTGVDFLTAPCAACDWIITNPPFVLAEAFIRRCGEHGLPFALLLKSQYWHAVCRYELFQSLPPGWILPLTWRPDFTGKGQALMDMMWVVWPRAAGSVTAYQPLLKPVVENCVEIVEKSCDTKS